MESRNFDIRKQLLEYDDVANDQRRAIYTQRNELLDVSDVSETINSIREDVFKATIDAHIPPQSLEEMWDIEGLQERLKNDFDLELPIKEWLDKEPELHEETLRERIYETALDVYKRKEEVVGAEMMRHFEKGVMLQTGLPVERARRQWTTCVRVSTCEVMRRKIRSRSTSVNPSPCLLPCWSR